MCKPRMAGALSLIRVREGDHAVKHPPRRRGKAVLFTQRLLAEHTRAHHGRASKQTTAEIKNRYRQRHRKLRNSRPTISPKEQRIAPQSVKR
ncbi:hypothetical protein KCP76_00215 [Salmonella enterica subsp. enterica serovar Weltevreden]|nr:hypothetical protein KCP76_00215 [Salmonella enterica subsp. enterica serovar Weltevreden]